MAKKENNVEEKQKTKSEEEKPKETTVEFLSSLAAVLVTGLFIITFVVQAFEIPSSSMENTLLIGDHVFVNRIQFAPKSSWVGPLLPYRDVHFRDIVVFLSPAEPGLYVVKRIIGLPGDHIHLRNGVVYRNGEALDEPYLDTRQRYRRILTATIFRQCRRRRIRRLSELDDRYAIHTFKGTILWFRRTITSPWAIIAA